MLMTNFLRDRKSERDFKKKKINGDTIKEINSLLNQLENEKIKGKVKFNFYEDGEFIYEKLEGIGGYSGVMIESPHYIGLEELDNDKDTKIYGSFYMEKLITDLNKLGLDTCWVGIHGSTEELKKEIFKDAKGQINYLLAVGYPKRKNPFVNDSSSERLGVEELVYGEEIGKEIDHEELENRGLEDLFYYARFAPSTGNLQSWRFLLGKDKVTLIMKKEEGKEANFIDAGIIMYYFEALGRSIGINGEWELIDGRHEDKDGQYEYIGEIKL